MTSPNIKLRGIRQVIPPGYFLGRLATGAGDVQLISGADLGQHLTSIGAVPKRSTLHGRLTIGATGPFANSQNFPIPPAPVAVVFPSAALSSVAVSDVAPTGNVTVYLVSNLASFNMSGPPNGVLASIAFTGGSGTGVITWTAATIAQNAVLTLVLPASEDPTFANLRLTFVGDVGET